MAGGAERVAIDRRAIHDASQQVGLSRLQRDKPGEHTQKGEKLRRVFGRPDCWLNLT